MSERSSALACLECGKPIPDGDRWLCPPQCTAVMTLVRYGRSHREVGPDPVDPDGLDVEPDLLDRYRRRARIVGRFPSFRVRIAVHHRDRGRCQYPGCTERGATRTDWRADDPSLKRVQAEDLRTLCVDHHRRESLRRFVGEGGQVARTGPAMWARIVSAKPLVLRDDESLWKDRKNLQLLSDWPLASEQTRRDLDDWIEALAEASTEANGVVGDHPLGQLALLNAALDKLELPQRSKDHLVRAVHAVLLKWQADEATREAVRQELAPGRDQPPAPEARRPD